MNKKEIALLERAFSSEIESALGNVVTHLMQTKSALAERLVEEGYLRKRSIKTRGPLSCTIEGYELTEAGRLVYCMSC